MTAFICPHFDARISKQQDLLNVLFNKVADARRKDINLFNFTHSPISVYEGLKGSRLISEKQILDILTEEGKGNRTSLILGNTGTGKSELCIYLSLGLEKLGKKVLYLEKSADLTKILGTDIASFYQNCVGKPFPNKEGREKLIEYQQSPKIAAELAIRGVILDFKLANEFDSHNDLIIELEEFAARKLQAIWNKEGTDSDIFEEADLQGNHRWSNLFKGKRKSHDPDELAREMSKNFRDTLYKQIGMTNLTTMLRLLQKDCKEKRIYIIFEDYAFEKTDTLELLDFMEEDSDENKFEFVIAATPDRVIGSKAERSTAKARFRFYRTNDDDGTVPFFTSEKIHDFITPFLVYPKTLDGSIIRSKGGIDPDNPLKNSLCEKCKRCPKEARSEFPFTNSFITKIFEGLIEKKPRLLIDTVLLSIKEYANERKSLSSASILLSENVTPPTADYLGEIDNEGLRDLLAWYGIRGTNILSVPKFIADTMDVDISDLDIEDENAIWELKEKKAGVNPSVTPDPISKRLDELLARIPNWKNSPLNEAYANQSSYILSGIRLCIEHLTTHFRISEQGSIGIKYGKGEEPIVISGKTAKINQITVDPKDINLDEAKAFLRLGYLNENRQKEASLDDTLEICGDQVASWVDEWRLKTSRYIDYIRFETDEGELSLADLSLLASELIIFFSDPLQNIDANLIQEGYAGKRTWRLHKNIEGHLKDRDLLESLSEFFSMESEIRGWLQYHYGIDEKSLRISEIKSRLRFHYSVSNASTIKRQNLKMLSNTSFPFKNNSYHGPVRFVVGERDFDDILIIIKKLSNSFKETDFTVKSAPVTEIMRIRRLKEAYLDIDYPRLATGVSNFLSRNIQIGLDRSQVQVLHSTFSDMQHFDSFIKSIVRIGEMMKNHKDLVALGMSYFAWLRIEKDDTFFLLEQFHQKMEKMATQSQKGQNSLDNIEKAIKLIEDVRK